MPSMLQPDTSLLPEPVQGDSSVKRWVFLEIVQRVRHVFMSLVVLVCLVGQVAIVRGVGGMQAGCSGAGRHGLSGRQLSQPSGLKRVAR